MTKNIIQILKTHYLLFISLGMLLFNFFLIIGLTSSNLIIWLEPPDPPDPDYFDRIVYIIFFYHVAGAWLSYFSFGISLICHVLYLKYKKIIWSRLGKNSIIVGVVFCAFTLITGSLWYNSTSGNYNNVYWQWSDARQTMTLILFLSYVSYLIFGSMIEDKEKKAKLTAALGIALFPTVPLSYISALVFTTLHPLINPSSGQTGHIYWDPIKLFILFFNLIAMTILFIYIVKELVSLDKAKLKLDEIIQKRLIEE